MQTFLMKLYLLHLMMRVQTQLITTRIKTPSLMTSHIQRFDNFHVTTPERKIELFWPKKLSHWWNYLSQFDSNILQLLGIPGRILVLPVKLTGRTGSNWLIFGSKWLNFWVKITQFFLGQNDSIFWVKMTQFLGQNHSIFGSKWLNFWVKMTQFFGSKWLNFFFPWATDAPREYIANHAAKIRWRNVGSTAARSVAISILRWGKNGLFCNNGQPK